MVEFTCQKLRLVGWKGKWFYHHFLALLGFYELVVEEKCEKPAGGLPLVSWGRHNKHTVGWPG